ncbi:iron ABC transporter permease [Acinetobacter qingfengensis]|uniref:FecR protein domain-containing protein n=1 Tax=Acinetobacter qingfengensis TaxID=1262585 RepID=A0A1E7RA18_9GAMM|nr:FecR domain-containing protein [Acinetobacter qingfengensis]KAA8730882.1 iron ABC transporter permease [Acinetobacter qingfengensis]OEY96148.1 hypothetical protein BJI46_12585 [Acinetobacter qingfengensis]
MNDNIEQQQEQLIEQAIALIVMLTADDAKTRWQAQQQLDEWKAQSPLHEKIVQDLQHSLNPIQQLSTQQPHKQLIQKVLNNELHHNQKRKKIKWGSTFAIVLVGSTLIYGYLSIYSPAYWIADVRSQQGQWQKQILSDGSEVILRSATAINLDFSQQQRVVELVQGEIYVNVAKDSHRPFIVKTPQGKIQALGTAFSVEKNPQRFTVLKMLHSSVQVETSHYLNRQKTTTAYPQTMQVDAGQAVKMYSNKILALPDIHLEQQQQKWRQHQIVSENLPLNMVLSELNQNYRGKIFYSQDLQDIRVNAVLPLDNTDEALALLAAAFPEIKIVRISPYLIYISKKTSKS